MRRSLKAALWVFLCLFAASGALADDESPAPVVVELFTSQGCSACPPAEALLRRLAADPGIIALALHVDYWDYLGWRDRFADPKFTARQKAYAHEAGERSVYTPQMVIGGLVHVPGNDEEAVLAAIAASRRIGPQARLTLERDGGVVRIVLAPRGPVTGPAIVHLLEVMPEASTDIARGENAGRTLQHRNLVIDWRAIGQWDGQGRWQAAVPADPTLMIVVLVQAEGPGAMLAAARLR